MKAKYVVLDADGAQSWDAKAEKGEVFSSQSAADKRALELASYEVGRPVSVYELVGEVTVPRGEPNFTRRAATNK